jgi:hypothetical protein
MSSWQLKGNHTMVYGNVYSPGPSSLAVRDQAQEEEIQ